jgi:hypothetical protein
MFGKDLTLAKVQMRLPGLVWGGVAMEAALGRKRLVSLRYIHLGKIRAAARVGLSILNRRQFCRGQKSRLER